MEVRPERYTEEKQASLQDAPREEKQRRTVLLREASTTSEKSADQSVAEPVNKRRSAVAVSCVPKYQHRLWKLPAVANSAIWKVDEKHLDYAVART